MNHRKDDPWLAPRGGGYSGGSKAVSASEQPRPPKTPASNTKQSLFRFEMWYVARRDDPYYYTNWDNKAKITIVAATKQEAINKADAALGGKPDRHWHHVFQIISITDHEIPSKEV